MTDMGHQTIAASNPQEYQAANPRECLTTNLLPSVPRQPIEVTDSPETPPKHEVPIESPEDGMT
eukprot:6977145-Alexandrium_andersonii.AAC.1